MDLKTKKEYFDDLAKVCTLGEVCELWCVDRKTVMNWIDKGYILATQEKNYAPWLVSVRSVLDYRGLPVTQDARLLYIIPRT